MTRQTLLAQAIATTVLLGAMAALPLGPFFELYAEAGEAF